MFLGIKIHVKTIKFGILLQKEVNGIHYFNFKSTINNENYVSQSKLWITPSIPLIPFMLIGFLFLIKYGDISHHLMNMVI